MTQAELTVMEGDYANVANVNVTRMLMKIHYGLVTEMIISIEYLKFLT